jgi:hypothetical protein
VDSYETVKVQTVGGENWVPNIRARKYPLHGYLQVTEMR